MKPTKKNEELNERFAKCSQRSKIIGLGLTEQMIKSSRFKNMTIDEIINQVWFGRYNSQKRDILKRTELENCAD